MNSKIKMSLIFLSLFYNINAVVGTLDTRFNQNGAQPGTVATNILNLSLINSIILSNNKLIVGGYAIDNTYHFALARYKRNGILDQTFNKNENLGPQKGIVITSIGISSSISSIIESGNKIIAAGISRIDENSLEQITLARYNKDGSLDETFNRNGNLGPQKGIVVPNLWLTSNAGDLIIDSNKNIIVVGSVWDPNIGHVFAVLRFKKNGRLDRSFNQEGSQPGVFTKSLGSFARARSVTIDSLNRIIVAGYSQFGLSVLRCNPDGTLDNTFNPAGAGVFSIMIGNNTPEFKAVVLDSQERIYLVGETSEGFTLIRLKNDGTLDETFNQNGPQPGITITKINESAQSWDLVLDTRERIIVNGFSTKNNILSFTIARYRPNGKLDKRFNPQGDQPGTNSNQIGQFSSSYTMALDKINNKILVGGYADNSFAIAKYLA